MNDLLYVCSPYRGDTKRNKEYARKLTRAALDNAVKGGSYDMNYAFAQSRLAAMLHIADMMATHLDERTEANE